jgi:lipopolysaccharide/colanic/teichoic acid biosynthesis glycosyltransferase
MVVIAAALWKVQGRPILDRHPVLGLGGRSFVTYKFRTGLLGSARRSLADPLPEEISDLRHITWLGAFLFRSGLDKLPQLLNVLQGRMSLVGPRTITDAAGSPYGPWLSSVLTVKPGMTGLWAVRSVPTLADEIRLTLYYIRNWTIWLDVQVLLRTAVQIVRRKGSRAWMSKQEEEVTLMGEGQAIHSKAALFAHSPKREAKDEPAAN